MKKVTQIVSLAAGVLLAVLPGYAASDLDGIWILNRAKSNLGAVITPEQLVVRLEQTDSRVAIWKITTDAYGQRLVHREYTLEGKRGLSVLPLRLTGASIEFPRESTGGMEAYERWQISKRRLIIHRSITVGSRTIHQRLVMDPSTRVEESTAAVRDE